MSELLRRKAAVEATMARFKGKRIDWKTADCVRMARFHLVQMGHKPPPMPLYGTKLGALKALKKAGAIPTILDGLVPRIAPAAMLLGDIAVLEGEGGMDAVFICAGHKLIGWHEDAETLVNVTALEVTGAWRA